MTHLLIPKSKKMKSKKKNIGQEEATKLQYGLQFGLFQI